MRAFLVVLLVAVLGAAVSWAWWSAGAGDPPPAGLPETPTPQAGPAKSSQPANADVHVDADLGPGLVATRAAVPVAKAGKLADAPSAWLRVVDRQGERPLAGAPIRRVQDGSDIAFTDERGLAAVALREPEQLAVVLDGYLMRLVPTRLGTSETEPQQVLLVRDEWSLQRRFEFAGPDGPIALAFVQLQPRAPAKKPPSPVPEKDAVAQRAWHEHQMLATMAAGADAPVQTADAAGGERVHRLANGAELRFAAAGDYVVLAATTQGLVARQDVRIEPQPRTDAPPVHITFTAGAFVQGLVAGSNGGAPLAGATVAPAGGDPLGLVATTSADGSFRLGPLGAAPVALLVRHVDHEPANFGPVQVPAQGVRIVLTALPTTTLRGRVRSRPDLRPVAGATVAWTPAPNTLITATTDADGQFTLRAPGGSAGRLAVQALGFVPYAELVAPGAAFADYDVWPADPQVRLAHRLSAVFEGVVVDREGRPLANHDVRWRPEQRAANVGVPGRRVLEGGTLELPLGTRSADDGTFRLETNAFGPGHLMLTDGSGPGLSATATPGQTSSGFRLVQ